VASQNILILSSDTGGGHRSAALALEQSLIRIAPQKVLVTIARVLEEACTASRWMADVYNYLLRNRQDWMEYYYSAIHLLKPNESKLVLQSSLRYGCQLLDRFVPHAIVSVHPMTQHFIAHVLKRLHLLGRIPLVTIVTDPCAGFWKAWACRDVQRYYVASQDAQDQLIDYGVPAEKITISGMPVNHRFQPVSMDDKPACKAELGLDPEKFTVFLNAGWVGGGNIPKVFEHLAGVPMDDIQVVYLTGQNQDLVEQAHTLASDAAFPIHIMPATDDMPLLMQASDIMVSKMGGLTTFEALTTGLPIIGDHITPPMPQERQTAQYVQNTGTGLMLYDPEAIGRIIADLKNHPDQLRHMHQSALTACRPNAADHIAQDILATLSPRGVATSPTQ
jgi:processive 1,2-diacylglycerol beta-glucosyltransferase